MAKNVFVLGLDEGNHTLLRSLPQHDRYRFHPLLSKQRLMLDEMPMPALLDEARDRMRSFGGPVDAIVGYWDFPVSTMVPILCVQWGLPSASVEAVVRCEHKYWSRLVQQEVTTAHPAFALVNPTGPPRPPAGLRYPMWVKPVKASASMFAYRVDGPGQFAEAVARVRDGTSLMGKALDSVLSWLEPPGEVADAGGQACLAEEALTGRQVTVEGYCCRGEVRVYGLVDTITYPGRPSFLRYQYPSTVPEPVARRMVDVTTRVVRHIGLDWCTFNVEFFWDADADEINLLEINPRISQSHAPLFAAVDGAPNHLCMVRLALGLPPNLPCRDGRHAMAAKWFLRTFSDGVVRRVPSQEEIAQAQRAAPGASVQVTVDPGTRLSHLLGQDTYSYRLAEVYVGGHDEAELVEKYRRCARLLPFEFEE
jgi:hypothetical protein